MDFALILTKLIDGIPFNALEREAAAALGAEGHKVIEAHRAHAAEQAPADPPADPTPSAGSDSPANGGSEPAGTSPGV